MVLAVLDLYRYMRRRKLNMEILQSIVEALQAEDFLASLDL